MGLGSWRGKRTEITSVKKHLKAIKDFTKARMQNLNSLLQLANGYFSGFFSCFSRYKNDSICTIVTVPQNPTQEKNYEKYNKII